MALDDLTNVDQKVGCLGNFQVVGQDFQPPNMRQCKGKSRKRQELQVTIKFVSALQCQQRTLENAMTNYDNTSLSRNVYNATYNITCNLGYAMMDSVPVYRLDLNTTKYVISYYAHPPREINLGKCKYIDFQTVAWRYWQEKVWHPVKQEEGYTKVNLYIQHCVCNIASGPTRRL